MSSGSSESSDNGVGAKALTHILTNYYRRSNMKDSVIVAFIVGFVVCAIVYYIRSREEDEKDAKG